MKLLSTIYPLPSVPLKNDAKLWRVLNIYRIMKSLGYDVDLVCYHSKISYKKIDIMNNFQEIKFKISFFPHFRYIQDLRDTYDAIYANTYWGGLNSLIKTSDKKLPIILDVHGVLQELSLLIDNWPKLSIDIASSMINVLDKVVYNRSDSILCVSKKMMYYLNKAKNVPLENMYYVTNGADLDNFKPVSIQKRNEIRSRLALDNKLVFGYIGDFQKWQGTENFINAALNINDDKLAFLIVGGSNSYKCKNINYISQVPRSELPSYYSACDVLVLPRPSHIATEVAAPTKFVEYASMQRPILTTNIGDAANFVKSYGNGIVVENNSADNLIRGIEDFKDVSDSELIEMGRRSRRMVEQEFDWNKIKYNLKSCLENYDI